jgi:uncharacterized membrane protein YfcA
MKAMKHTGLYVGIAVGIVIGLLLARASLVALLPWAFILLCPLMMMLMMRGSHHGADHHHTDKQSDRPAPPTRHVASDR